MNETKRVSHAGDSIESAKETFAKALDEAAKGGYFMAAVWGSKNGRNRLMGRTTFNFEKEDFETSIRQLEIALDKEMNSTEEPLPAPLPKASDLPLISAGKLVNSEREDSVDVVGNLVDKVVASTEAPPISIPTNDPENPFIRVNSSKDNNENVVE